MRIGLEEPPLLLAGLALAKMRIKLRSLLEAEVGNGAVGGNLRDDAAGFL